MSAHRLACWLGWALSCGVLAAACGVKAPPSGGDENLPNAKSGPFRVLREGEMPPQDRSFPYAIRRKGSRDPSVLDIDGNPATHGVWMYVAAPDINEPDGTPTLILRYDAGDGRSFPPRDPDATVLEVSETWEGGLITGPSALRVGSEIWLYYAAAGGIGLAVSSDGTTFTKRPEPVFTRAAAPNWEGEWTPSDPSVVLLDDGTYRMFYESGIGIGEARSSDGIAWERMGDGPALWPVAQPDFPTPEEDTVYEPFDDVAVGDPCAVLDTSELGRRILRVYYAGTNRIGLWALGQAARYGFDGALQRAYGPVLGNSYTPKAPSVVFFDDFTLLYFTAPATKSKPEETSAIGIGVAPATVSLAL